MYLFIALARLHGIPARAVGGYVVAESQIVRPAEYHNWAEIYLDGAWHVVDPQKRVFRERQADYVAMRIIQRPEHSLLAGAHRYKFDAEVLNVAMN